MKRLFRLFFSLAVLCGALVPVLAQNTQQLAFAGLRSFEGKGQFLSVKRDAAGNLYLLYDQKDGVRLLKTDALASHVLAETRIGAAGDTGVALALDAAGNVFVAGNSYSQSLPTTSGVPFPTAADASLNAFVARFDSGFHTVFVTYAGSGRMSATGIAVANGRVFLTGGIYTPTLPVTPSAILQVPSSGSTGGNGFVECFSADGTQLLYATYLRRDQPLQHRRRLLRQRLRRRIHHLHRLPHRRGSRA